MTIEEREQTLAQLKGLVGWLAHDQEAIVRPPSTMMVWPVM